MASPAPLNSAKKSPSFSRQGFHPINAPQPYPASMPQHNDATIDIPLEQVVSNGGGYRNQSSTSQLQPTQTLESHGTVKRRLFRGRRQKSDQAADMKKGTGKIGYDGEEDTINTMGKIYRKIRDFSVFTRYLLYVLPVAALIAIPIIIGASYYRVEDSPRIGTGTGVPIQYFFSWIEVVWGALWLSKLVASYLPAIFQVFAGVVSSGVRKYSLVLRALNIPLSLVGWAICSLATFVPIMTRNNYNLNTPGGTNLEHWMLIVQRVLGAALVCTLIFLGEKFIIQLISINYHRKQFNARIKESKRHILLLGLLYDASRRLFPMYCHEFAEEDYAIADQLNISRLGGKSKKNSKRASHARSGSVTPMRLLANAGRVGDKITSAFGNMASEITGKEVFNPNSSHSIVVEALERKRTAEALARRVWMSFVLEGNENLYLDDIVDVMGPDQKELAEEAFWAIDRDGNGDISLEEMIMQVTEFSRERKSIASSMHDVDQAINVLDNLLSGVVFLAVVLVFIAFLNTSFVTTLATTGTALLSLSFVFSVTAQEVLGSCIFLFVKHPYDIGDRVDINKDQFIVEHISLLFTVFRRVSGANVGRICQVPNIVLNTLFIENITRSKAMTEQIQIDISFDTTFDDVELLKGELMAFVSDKDNTRDFVPEIGLEILGTTDQSKLSLKVEVQHKSNWANETIRQARRSKFMCALVAALKRVPIYPPGGGSDALGSPENPSYSVAVETEQARQAVKDAAAAREAARLVSTKSAEEKKAEDQIIDDLTKPSDPTSDPVRDRAWVSSRDEGSVSTLGGRPSGEMQDLDEVRGILRRQSSRGKRKPSSEISRYQSSVPTINEQHSSTYPPYQQPVGYPRPAGYENQRPVPGYSITPFGQPPNPYQSPPPQVALPAVPNPAIEMSQVSRTGTNPYTTARPADDEDEKSPRSYTGV